ncbi:MAG: hypothetical protein [Cressdnaviricota sp.]|nr:MAG: hypothetical protein [Cressdnaviricota sp.]
MAPPSQNTRIFVCQKDLTAKLLLTDLHMKSWIFSFNIKFFYPRFQNQIYATKMSHFETYRQIFRGKIYAPLLIQIYLLCLL